MTTLETLAAAHLALRLRPLNRALRAAVERQAAAAARLARPGLTPYCITDEQVGYLLDQVSGWALEQVPQLPPVPLTGPEREAERELREQAAMVSRTLPLDEMADRLGLTPEEQGILLLCAAPELDRSYERIFAYVLDDLNRRFPCAELIGTVTAPAGADRLTARGLLGRAGRLRRLGLLRPHGAAPSELRQEFRVPLGLVDFLLGSGGELTTFAHDPGVVATPPSFRVPPHLDATRIERLGRAVHAGAVDLVGVWGPERAGRRDAVLAVTHAAGMAVRQLPAADPDARRDELAAVAAEAIDVAASLGAVLWIPTDPLDDRARQVVAELLARSRTPACLSGTHPWRPTVALCSRAYAELDVRTPEYGARKAMWFAALPELAPTTLEDLASRYRMSSDELRAVASLTRTELRIRGNGQPAAGDAVVRAVAAVANRSTDGFARPIRPSRTLDDLVLPDAQLRTVEELLAAFRVWPRVAETWGFASSAGGGVKALFIGEPGTGKTLAAEVIAGVLGLVLLKVDMARVVSKWVGETEKHLEAAFQHAEDSQAVLFFDEADALFGKRGDIKQGLDRFANFEVGFLLQRLEQSDCLAILASNLKENIDHAFVRRFQYVLQFPRPGQAERERIWRLAFPTGAPLGQDIDLAALARLDMTGAAIAGAARSAALLAADAASPVIAMVHAVRGVHRQYQRDARLLRPEELGRHAVWLEGAHG